MSNAKFQVSAESELLVTAERATIHIELSVKNEDKAVSYDTAVPRHNRLAAFFKEHPAVVEYKFSVPQTYSSNEWHRDKPKLHYVTSSHLEAVFEDLAVVGELIADLSVERDCSVAVTWSLKEETQERLEKELRRSVLQRAKTIAADYASGVGIPEENIHLVSMTDVKQYSPMRAMAFAGSMENVAAAEQSPIPLVEPEELRLASSVEAIFEGELPA